ncbi:MAG: hypothetical protein ACK5ZV_07065 [bacterium]
MASKTSLIGNGSGGNGNGDGPAGEEIQRWTAGRKAVVALDIIKAKPPLHPGRCRPAARP